jgi:hypothetical protein
MKPLSFTRQNVYNFCVKLDGSEKMRTATEKVLDEGISRATMRSTGTVSSGVQGTVAGFQEV